MLDKKRIHPKEKSNLHPRNKHRERYNFKELITSYPELSQFVSLNKYDDESIDFSNPQAVKALNQALLQHFYGIQNWDIPESYLCPPIPGRVDYIHYIADLLAPKNRGAEIRCLDIGMGANCIYPLLGMKEYGWSFVATDIDNIAISAAKKIIEKNPSLQSEIEFRLQESPRDMYRGIIKDGEKFDISICNPPFHSSAKDAERASIQKITNLTGKQAEKAKFNFGGMNQELWYKGGEKQFVKNMIFQSKHYKDSCTWFTTLVSKGENLSGFYRALEQVNARYVRTIEMGQGNKISRILAWSFEVRKKKN